ncbi:hypothetical protein BTA51_14790 [Hahella sp. CCB-MM4]|uniref:sensor histidine kinase n=1 Tax=Hahella sp. (strain CCB-MM4) TaxID=1926491 RepID=UPI000B9B63B6|nr:HAMP domain-containing sensor histidine kinase [Hahella sp. CCB-MM4]OZG72784.1 hypothetical protein BTA51_14790 [Hahella sp. CCB-MM4]
MNFLQSLRFRILTSFVLFALAVTVCFSLLVLFVAEINDDELFNWHIANEASHGVGIYIDGQAQSGFGSNERTFIGNDESFIKYLLFELKLLRSDIPIPPNTKTLEELVLTENVSETRQGYQIFELRSQGKKIHVVRSSLPQSRINSSLEPSSTEAYFYYLTDVSGFDLQTTYALLGSVSLLGISVIFTLIVAVLVGHGIARHVVAPLTRLSQDVDSATVDHKPVLKGHYYPDEVGFLANRINAMLRRIEDFVEREKAFARDASHELRTPVTSSRMALELAIPLVGDNEKLHSLLLRASRANQDMTHLIESFMLLGKEESHSESKQQLLLQGLAQSALDKNAYLLRDKPIQLINGIPGNLQVEQPLQLLSIVMNNLVRNAFQYTTEGTVEISADSQSITVEDTGKGFPSQTSMGGEAESPEGMGLGLNIVRRICQLRHWKLDIQHRKNGGTRIILHL